MSSASSTAAPTAGPAGRVGVRRAARDTQEPIIGGVAAGLARHLAFPVVWVRAAFVLAAVLGGFGVVFYAGLWLVLPADTRFETQAPGLESATRGGRRPGRIRRLSDVGPAVALAALGFGGILLLEALLGRGAVFWPLFLGLVGIALLWRQADEAQRERWLDTTGRIDPVRVVLGSGGWASYARLAAGIALVVAALVLFTVRGGSISMARDVTVATLLAVVGLGIVVGPWIYRLASDLTAERAERVRTQERADVAAHLHDSVLQTLALIQKNAADGPMVARLARSQERDLRAWLYAGESTDERTTASALRGAAARVEDAHGVSVDVVTVGDCDFTESLRPIVNAAGEAVTNAAKHAGTGRVDVYAEVTDAAVDIFVRDRGLGFDPEAVPGDRYGVRRSIVDRMQRHGGTAEIRSTPGEGTEVRLHLPRAARQEETDA
jgi:signal transduction histidine kinase